MVGISLISCARPVLSRSFSQSLRYVQSTGKHVVGGNRFLLILHGRHNVESLSFTPPWSPSYPRRSYTIVKATASDSPRASFASRTESVCHLRPLARSWKRMDSVVG